METVSQRKASAVSVLCLFFVAQKGDSLEQKLYMFFTSCWRLICRAYHKRSLSVALLAMQAESGPLISRPVALISLAPMHASPTVISGAPSIAICTGTSMGAGGQRAPCVAHMVAILQVRIGGLVGGMTD